jgi:hypothetical protein
MGMGEEIRNKEDGRGEKKCEMWGVQINKALVYVEVCGEGCYYQGL